jgi:hypothetical protein
VCDGASEIEVLQGAASADMAACAACAAFVACMSS